MAKEKFNWKGLFINEETSGDQKSQETTPKADEAPVKTFPTSSTSNSKFPDQPPKPVAASSDILGKVIEMYESGFDSLNTPGYDFYEFFKAIQAVGSNDASVYKMALTMAQGVDPKVTKTSLLSQADFYIKEIDKVHKQYATQGNSKKNSILSTQKNSKDALTNEITALEKQLLELQNKISQKKEKLQSLDVDLMTDVSEIDQKIIANDAARSKILETITTVIDGIKNNL